MCLDKTYKDLQDDLKSYTSLTVLQGQIRFTPRQKSNMRAFMHWVRHFIRQALDPASLPFPVTTATALLRQEKSHIAYVEKSKTIIESTKPPMFRNETKWHDGILFASIS